MKSENKSQNLRYEYYIEGMNIMAKRVYRGRCPYESFFESELEENCRNCRNFAKCRRLEMKRRRKVKHRRKVLLTWGCIIILAVTVILTMMLGIVSLIKVIRDNIKSDTKTQNENSIVIGPMSPEAKIEIKVEFPTEESELQNAESALSSDIAEDYEQEETESNIEEENEAVPARISAYEAGETYYYNLSYEEKVYIAKVVYAESRGECFEGQVAVAATVLNRYTSNDARFCRESIYSVVTQSGQYASISGITMEDLNAVPSCMEAVEAACKGWDSTRVVFSDGAKFFFNPDGDLDELARKEREGVETYQIGAHLFHNDLNVVN